MSEATIDLAWKVVDHWVEDYASKDHAIEELGDLDDLVLKVSELVEELELDESDGMVYLSCTLEDRLF